MVIFREFLLLFYRYEKILPAPAWADVGDVTEDEEDVEGDEGMFKFIFGRV